MSEVKKYITASLLLALIGLVTSQDLVHSLIHSNNYPSYHESQAKSRISVTVPSDCPLCHFNFNTFDIAIPVGVAPQFTPVVVRPFQGMPNQLYARVLHFKFYGRAPPYAIS